MIYGWLGGWQKIQVVRMKVAGSLGFSQELQMLSAASDDLNEPLDDELSTGLVDAVSIDIRTYT